jgi:lipoate-protein ligase A
MGALTPVRVIGTVAELHARDPFGRDPAGGDVLADGRFGLVGEPAVWWCDFTDAAIVLGSAQGPEVLDAAACAAAGLSVVRRRSGGGAVLLRPGAVVWLDIVVPAGRWPDDVRATMVRAGELWRTALVDSGTAPAGLAVHAGGMVTTAWSQLVCFDGTGPGEVLDTGRRPPRKLVGLSQRRTRHGLRIQGLVHTGPLVAETARLLAADRRPAGTLGEQAVLAGGEAAVLAAALANALAGLDTAPAPAAEGAIRTR